jgi:hypothetical protein
MFLLRWLLRGWLMRRLFGGGRQRRGYGYGGRGYGGYGGRGRSGGFRFFGPFPTYSTRTRRGSRVSVSGCCLPIPLALTLGAALGARSALRR